MSPKHWPWDVLELEEGARSRSDVRKAYARKLKLIDQDTEPEKFQQLRQAYEAARDPNSFVHFARVMPPEPVPKPVPKPKPEPEPAPKPEPTPTAPPPISDDDRALLEDALPDRDEIETLCKKMELKVTARDFDLKAWVPLLTSPVLDAPTAKSAFEFRLIAALHGAGWRKNGGHFFPPDAWVLLVEDRFGWVEDGLRFFRQFPNYTEMHRRFAARVGTSTADQPLKPGMAPKPKTRVELPYFMRPWVIFVTYTVLYLIYKIAIR